MVRLGVLSVSIDSNNHINTYSTHNMLVNNQEGQVANFSIEYSHVLEQKNEVGNYEEEDNNTVPVPPDNGDFNVNGDSSYDHNDLFRDRGGRYGDSAFLRPSGRRRRRSIG